MRIEFKKGYTIFKKGNQEIAFITPHSGPAIGSPVNRDDHSETVAGLCWEEIGGTLIISHTSRNRVYGVDFNRYIPNLKKALEMFNVFLEDKEEDKIYNYKKKYAWVAKDEKDYYERLKIYQNFWMDAGISKYIVLIHRAFPKIKAVPSIMDIITFSEKGVDAGLIKKIIEEINSKYFDFFGKIAPDYKQAIIFETRRYVLNLLRIYEHFNPTEMSLSAKENIEKDLEKVTKYADKISLNRLKQFTPDNFLNAVKHALEHIPMPQVTIESVHNGSLALGPYNKLFPQRDKVIIEVESNGFLNFWHPHMAAKILKDIIMRLKDENS